MFSFYGETVLDPFVGSGTTSLAAKNLGRNSLGYEINKNFKNIIQQKIVESENQFCFVESYDKNYNFDSLPYLFNDPNKIHKKNNNKNYKIKEETLYSVKQVISPEKIYLNNDLTIRLIGIKENPKYREQAISFLKEKFKKRKVFLKYDKLKYYSSNTLLCYVYLDNKTFINNHLIRTGFVDVDVDFDYSCKNKFLNSLLNK